mgnify:FL=1
MLKEYRFDGVAVFRMGRTLGPVVPYVVHSFLLGEVLIDTGTAWAGKEFARALEGRCPSLVLNTHHHEDHIGNNRLLSERGARILAPSRALPYLENPRRINLRLYQRVVWDWPRPSGGEALGDRVEAGEYCLEVLPVSGHSEDHVCFFEAERRWLFTGDMFCGTRNIYLRQDEDFHPLLDSLKRLRELRPSVLFCSLMGVVEEGGAALEKKIAFMEEIAEKVPRLREAGKSPAGIRKALLGGEDRMYYMTGGHFSKQNLIDSILKHDR